MKLKKVLTLVCTAAIGLSLIACGAKSDDKGKDSKETIKVSHLQGETEIPKNPKRIADVSGAAEELLILGYKPVVTANTFNGEVLSHIKDKLEGVPAVGNAWGDAIDIEKVAESNPDLIILNNRQVKIYDQLSKIAPTIVLKEDMSTWRPKFKELGAALSKEKEVDKWLDAYDTKAKDLQRKVADKTKDSKFMFLGVTPKAYRIYGSYGYADILFNDLKVPYIEGTPIDKALEQMNMEAILKYNPDAIFAVSFGGAADKMLEDLKANSLWKNSKAVKNDKVFDVNYEEFSSKAFGPLGKEVLIEQIADRIIKSFS
ncbi:ABC transporter substrate-binding protein [Clostridium hydrogeniformans]|uniref:ABC transporter substrate-binding protein n=1 Tax=Clostridium hydrogeniformans TaxID=349933 RepID=UPI000482B2A8|nr:ABC transporter substrate-binding protein [Clostridium hydrogeniformans]